MDALATLEMLGECFVLKGQTSLAARVFERATRLEGVGDCPHVALDILSGTEHARCIDSRLKGFVEARSNQTLAALHTLAPLAASLTVALAALEPHADARALFAAANCEQDWQAELWGWDPEAERLRSEHLATFEKAALFARLARART